MRRTLLGSAVLLAALTLTGCTAMSGMSSSVESGAGGSASEPMPADGGMVQADGDFATIPETGSGADASAGTATTERSEIVTGNVTITADDPIEASREAVKIVEAAGGRIDDRTEYAPANGDAGSASLTLRVPADRMSAVLDDLEELGRADEVSLSTSDVTVQVQDLDARISALRSSVTRLEALVAQASDIDDLITLENALSDRQGQLESLEAQQRYLADQVDMSTVSLWLRSEAQAPEVVPGDFWAGVVAGWNAFVAFWAGLLVVVGVLVPWLVALAVIAGVVVLIVRTRRRRRAARAAEAAASSAQAAPASAAEPEPSSSSSDSSATP